MEFLASLRHEGEGGVYFFIVSDIAILVVVKTQKTEVVNSICNPPYQCRIQSKALVFRSIIYFCYVHVDGNTVSTANIMVVMEKILFSFPRLHIYSGENCFLIMFHHLTHKFKFIAFILSQQYKKQQALDACCFAISLV